MQLAASILLFHIALFLKSGLLREEVAVCKFEMNRFVFPGFSICIAQKAVTVSQLWSLAMKKPWLRAGSVDALLGVSR